MLRAFAFLCLVACPALAGPGPGSSVAFLGLHFIDTSTEGAYFGIRDDEIGRVALLENEVREWLTAADWVLVDTAPASEDMNRVVNLAKCYGCEVRIGQKLGADYVLVGEVQKVSNLILAMNLVLRDTGDGTMVRGRSVDIRSNTDESWLRGIRYILKTEILK